MSSSVAGPQRWAGEPRPRKSAAPRKQLTHEQIVDAALRILDNEGLDAVSMRRVGQELDTGAASLYAHVQNKEDLIQAVFDRVIGEVPVPEPGTGHWIDQMVDFYLGMRQVLIAHRDIAKFALARIPTGPHALEITEQCLAIMRHSGLPDQVIAWACDMLPLYVTASAYEESLYLSRFPNATPAEISEYISGYVTFFAGLAPDRFPHLAALAGAMMNGDSVQRFRFGLESLLRGMEAYAAAHPEI